MKIRISKTCECMYDSSKLSEPEDCRLEEGIILEGKVKPTLNWEGKPMPAIDLYTGKSIYYAIPNDSWLSCTKIDVTKP